MLQLSLPHATSPYSMIIFILICYYYVTGVTSRVQFSTMVEMLTPLGHAHPSHTPTYYFCTKCTPFHRPIVSPLPQLLYAPSSIPITSPILPRVHIQIVPYWRKKKSKYQRVIDQKTYYHHIYHVSITVPIWSISLVHACMMYV